MSYPIAWQKDHGSPSWSAFLAEPKWIKGHVALTDAPERFVVHVFARDEKVHESEHACLCDAKAETEAVMKRAAKLREGMT